MRRDMRGFAGLRVALTLSLAAESLGCARTERPAETFEVHAPRPRRASPSTPSSSASSTPPSPTLSPSVPHPSAEASLALFGTRLLVTRGRIHDRDAGRLEHELGEAYARMRADEDDPASPVRFREAPLPRAGPDELLVYEPSGPDERPKTSAVVFLHGYGGRFALPCWQIARAVARHRFTTACPSIGPEGDFWTREGEARVRATVAILREAGYERLVLAGLSNGAIGASRLPPDLLGSFAGVVLISGVDPTRVAPHVPTLVVQGRHDTMVSPDGPRAYAKKARAKYLEVDSGHFALLFRAAEVERAIGELVGSL